MIDTIKIYTEIDKITYTSIYNKSIIKTSYNKLDGEVYYEIVNDHLLGSYDSRLSVRIGCGSKYQFTNLGYYIEIEGSYHKIIKGYNSHNGFCDLEFISKSLINMVQCHYNIKLPNFGLWYLQRCDIAICYDLKNQFNVISYINSLSRCNYPRRNIKFFYDESLYLSGSTTTLKIYNKLLEFRKHDMKKFVNTSFDLENYINTINGFVRFECEIKKKKLVSLFDNAKHIKICDVNYDILKNVWSEEFMKLLKYIESDLHIVRGREDVKKRLNTLYNKSKASRLYNFYCAIQLNGLIDTKNSMSKSSYYRNIKELEISKIDFSQTYKIVETNMYYFNPFEEKEVA